MTQQYGNQAAEIKKQSFFSRLAKDLKKYKGLYLLALPVFIYYAVFVIIPLLGNVIAFQDYSLTKGILGSKFVGLKHFTDFVTSMNFGRVVKNTLVINITSLIFGFPAPIILALLIHELKSVRYSRTVQTVTYLPHFISLVVLCGIVRDFTAADGLIGSFVARLTGVNMDMLGQSKYFVPIYVISGIWQGVGWGSIVYLAALTSLDSSLYEAASLDGAGKWKQFVHVTFPGILPTILTMLIMRIGQFVTVGSEKILLLYNPNIYDTSDVIQTYLYRKGMIDQSYSFSTAVGIFNSLISCVLLIFANTASKKLNDVSLW